MKKIVTSVTAFTDAVGMRLSATYSEMDENTGAITSDNNRFDRVIVDPDALAAARTLLDYAGSIID